MRASSDPTIQKRASGNPLRFRRILSSLVCSDPLGKFSTLLYFPTAYKVSVLDP